MADEWQELPPATAPEMERLLRMQYGNRVKVTSDYRTKAYNESLRQRGYHPAKNSLHTQYNAVDILPIKGVPIEDVRDFLASNGFNMTEALHHDGHYHLAADKHEMPEGWSEVPEDAAPAPVQDTVAAGGLPSLVKGEQANPMVQASDGAGFFSRLGRSYKEAVQYGFPGLMARKYHDWMDTGMEAIKRANPNASPQELEALQENLVNQTQKDLREQYAKESERDPAWRPDENWIDNIASGRWAPWLLGQIGGSAGPENLLMPGASAGARIAGQVGINAGADVLYQGAEVADGVRKEYNPIETAAAGVFGGGFQALGELGKAGAKYLKKVTGSEDIGPVAADAIPDGARIEVDAEGNRFYLDENGQTVYPDAPPVEVHVQSGGVNPEAPATIRVYHGGVDAPDSGGGRWVSTNREYAKNYRDGGTLYYTDLPADDPRVNNPDYPDQGVAQGHTFNFELTPEEAASLRRADVSEAPPAADGLPGNGSVRPMDPQTIARIMGDPEAAGIPSTIETPNTGLPETASPDFNPAPEKAPTETGDGWQDIVNHTTNETAADAPPVTHAGNINLNRIVRSADIDAMVEETAKNISATPEQGRAATEELANDLGTSVENLLAKDPRLSEAPQYAVAIRNLMSQSLQNLQALAVKVRTTNLPEDRAALANAWAAHGAIQERASRVGNAAGRLLDSFNINAKGGANYARALKNIPNELFDSAENIDRLAQLIEAADSPEAVNKIIRDSHRPKAEDYIFSAWYNMLLSGPKTHVANILGNSSSIVMDLVSHGFASVGGQMKRLTGGERIAGREVGARIMGAMAGAIQGVKNMPMAFREGVPLDQVGRLEAPNAIQNKVLSSPTRALAAEDEFFRSVAVMSDLYGQATNLAIKEGKTGKDLWARVTELVNDPTDKMLKQATEYGKRMRFQDTPGVIAQKIEQARTTHIGDTPGERAAKAGLRLLIPFSRTPSNLFRMAARYSPVAVAESVNFRGLKAGGREADLAKARIAMGAGIGAALVSYAMSGELSGDGPSDFNKRKELEASGWQANSVKIGDTWYSYKGLEPFSYLLNAAGNLHDRATYDDDKDVLSKTGAFAVGLGDIVTDNTWMENLNQFFEAKNANDGGTGFKNWAASLGSSMTVPAFLRQLTQTADPAVRVTTGDGSLKDRYVGRVQSGLPGFSGQLPQSMDIYGRPEVRDFAGPDIASRISKRTETDDPVIKEVNRLAPEDKALVGTPQKTIKVDGVQKKLNAEEAQTYQYLSGQYILEAIRQEMAKPEWKTMSDADRRKAIKEIKTDMRKAAREQLFSPEAAQWKEVN